MAFRREELDLVVRFLTEGSPELAAQLRETSEWGETLRENFVEFDGDMQKLGVTADDLKASLERVAQQEAESAAQTEGFGGKIKDLAGDIRRAITTLGTLGAAVAFARKVFRGLEKAVEAAAESAEVHTSSLDREKDRAESLAITLGERLLPFYTELIRAKNDFFETSQGERSVQGDLQKAYQMGLIGLLEYSYALLAARSGSTDLAESLLSEAAPAMKALENTWNPEFLRQMEEGMSATGEAAGEVAGGFEDAEGAVESFFDSIDRNTGDVLEDMARDFDYVFAGGVDYTKITQGIKSAVDAGRITPEQGDEMVAEVLVAWRAMEVEMGEATFEEAAKSLEGALFIPIEEARRRLQEFDGLDLSVDLILDLSTRGFSAGYLENIQSAGGYYDPRLGTYVPFGGGKATGGPVSAGTLYQVNERGSGPEVFIPNMDGVILNRDQQQTMSGSGMDQATGKALLGEIQGLRQDIAQANRRADDRMSSMFAKRIGMRT